MELRDIKLLCSEPTYCLHDARSKPMNFIVIKSKTHIDMIAQTLCKFLHTV